MIFLDTNVISETMKPGPDPFVMEWLNRQDLGSLWLTVITVAELRYGVARLEPGRRRNDLETRINAMVNEVFSSRVASFNESATGVFADKAASARRKGRMVEFADAAIAAIAISSGFAIATRDTGPFLDMGAEVIDPWRV